jgi:predicted permease
MFMNSNALPIALMQSLVVSVPDLMWGNNDNKDVMLGRALTYLTMYSTLGMVVSTFSFFSVIERLTTILKLRNSYGIKLLSRADTILQPEGNTDERTPLLKNSTTLTSPPSSSSSTLYDESDCQDPIRPFKNNASLFPPANQNKATFYNSFPNSPNDSRPALPRYDSASDTEYDDEAILPTYSRSKPCLHHLWRYIVRAAAILNSFMTVPLWSALLSLLVACIEPLKHTLLNHLQPVDHAISNAEECLVPLTLVVLGACFYVPDESTETRTFVQSIRDIFRRKNSLSEENQIKPNPGETKTVILSVASRMIITPSILIPGMALATKYNWHEVLQE